MDKVLFDGKGSHGHYRVVERVHSGRLSRLLLSEDLAPQSGIALDDDPELLFEYNQRFLEIALSLQPRPILVIGGGAFTLPMALVKLFPKTKVTVVEIDSKLPDLANKYFGLSDHKNLTIVNDDGRDYINNTKTKYDLIVVDAFNGYSIPRSLLSTESGTQYARVLKPSGVLALNIISTYYGAPSIAHQIAASFNQSFRHTELYPSDLSYEQSMEQNLIFIAHQGDSPNLDYLQSHQVEFRVPVDIDMQIND